jgi:hypothetical protein
MNLASRSLQQGTFEDETECARIWMWWTLATWNLSASIFKLKIFPTSQSWVSWSISVTTQIMLSYVLVPQLVAYCYETEAHRDYGYSLMNSTGILASLGQCWFKLFDCTFILFVEWCPTLPLIYLCAIFQFMIFRSEKEKIRWKHSEMKWSKDHVLTCSYIRPLL